MITKFLVLPHNFIKLKIKPSFSTVKLPLKRKYFGKIIVEDRHLSKPNEEIHVQMWSVKHLSGLLIKGTVRVLPTLRFAKIKERPFAKNQSLICHR